MQACEKSGMAARRQSAIDSIPMSERRPCDGQFSLSIPSQDSAKGLVTTFAFSVASACTSGQS